MQIDYLRVRDAGAWERVREIRQLVYVDEQAIPAELEWDEHDKSCEHRLLTVDGVDAACSRWRWTSPGLARLERFAVLRAFRGRGLGREIVGRTMREALDCGARRLEISAQAHLDRFYGSFGFVTTGAPFDEAGLPHLPMVCEGGAARI